MYPALVAPRPRDVPQATRVSSEIPVPRLSVVVASQDAERTIFACLEALRRDAEDARVSLELVVADASRDRSAEIARGFPGARVLRLPATTLVPSLWSAGIAVARGTAIAVTTAAVVPARGWVLAMLDALATGASGVGGAIECAPGASIVDRAIYFTRYSAYMLPFPAVAADDLPGDNACYDATALRRFRKYVEGPFAEPFLHADMRRAGYRLRREPAAVVAYVHSYPWWRFLKLRFQHGWGFGIDRAEREPAARSAVRALSFPLVVVLLVSRVFARGWSRRERRRDLIVSLPLVVLFLSSFAAGECLGALTGALRRLRLSGTGRASLGRSV